MARISVLMGVYNCASTLPEALDSLYSQTYKDFKIILCDDGSQDNTYKIAKEYVEKYDNIVLISNGKNKGLNYTLNHCLEYADTEYCARMDGDDISLPLKKLHSAMLHVWYVQKPTKRLEGIQSHPNYFE